MTAQKNITVFLGIVASACSATSCLLAISGWTKISFSLAAISSIINIMATKRAVGNYFALSTIFMAFGFFYGIMGAMAAFTSEGLPDIFPKPYYIDIYLFNFGLAGIGSALAITIAATEDVSYHRKAKNWKANTLLHSAVFLALLGTAFEALNVWRAGSIFLLFQGKAEYQSAMSDMTGTLPSEWVVYTSAALLGLAMSNGNKSISSIIPYIFAATPNIVLWVILGRRLELINFALIMIASWRFLSPVSSISAQQVILITLTYTAIGVTYAFRGFVTSAYLSGDITIITEQLMDVDHLLKSLNPASSEFQAPFGNFNTHIALNRMDESRLGESYFSGLSGPIPRFIWPDKPISIAYEFRDIYFPQEVERGSIAGTGFSALLEAYLNFGSLGLPIFYGLLTWLIIKIDIKRYKFSSKWFDLFYILMIPFALFFPRQPMEVPFFMPLMCVIMAAIIYYSISTLSRIR